MQNYLSLVNPDNPQTCLMLSDEFEGFHAEQLKLMPAPIGVIYLSTFERGYGHNYIYGNGDGYGYEDVYGEGYGDGYGSLYLYINSYENGVGYAKLSISS